jgi:nucleoside-diphosphate-sugar epimerase
LAHIKSVIPEVEYDRVNREMTRRIARAAQTAGAKIIYISSIAAQSGTSRDSTLVESGPMAPTTPYGRSKLAAEQEVIAAGGRHVIFRPSLTYGGGVVGNIGRLVQISTGHIPPPFGALHNKRSLLAVENMCQAVRFALETEPAEGETFLLADPEPVSVAEMVRLLRRNEWQRTARTAGAIVNDPPTVRPRRSLG